MKARLFCKTGILSGKSIDFRDAVTIGKDAESDLVLDTPVISSAHARIFFDKKSGCYVLEDLRSRNGTKLDGVKVSQKEKLGPLHVITFAGQFDFIFQAVDRSMSTTQKRETPATAQIVEQEKPIDWAGGASGSRTMIDQEIIVPPKLPDLEMSGSKGLPDQLRQRTMNGNEAMTLARKPDQSTAPAIKPESNGTAMTAESPRSVPKLRTRSDLDTAPAVMFLDVAVADGNKQTFRLQEGENLIGRTPGCAIRINDPSLSRQHALLTVKAGKAMLRDLESRNHTYLDKKLVTAEVEVRPQMKIRFGTVEAMIRTE
jgi:pSer/pThr/pTyr-binding forkhead associated (FHA) protein